MFKGKTRFVALAIAVSVGAATLAFLGILGLAGQLLHPRDQAIQDVRQCLETAEPSYDVCGRLIEQAAWATLQEQLDLPNSDYFISIVWYNWEDNVCCRGGDEILLRVDFANSETFYLLWYDGLLEQFVTFETPPSS